jgi:hypothetical protein
VGEARENYLKFKAYEMWTTAAQYPANEKLQSAFIEFCSQAGLLDYAAARYVESACRSPEHAAAAEKAKADILRRAMGAMETTRSRRRGKPLMVRLKTPLIIMIGALFFILALVAAGKFFEISGMFTGGR